MGDERDRYVALVIFLASLAGLLLLQPPHASIKDIRTYGKLYKVCGYLAPVKELRKGCVYNFSDETGFIKAVSFFGECVTGYACFYARLDEYRGEKELVILSYS